MKTRDFFDFWPYMAFGGIWQHGKYCYRVWQSFAYNSGPKSTDGRVDQSGSRVSRRACRPVFGCLPIHKGRGDDLCLPRPLLAPAPSIPSLVEGNTTEPSFLIGGPGAELEMKRIRTEGRMSLPEPPGGEIGYRNSQFR